MSDLPQLSKAEFEVIKIIWKHVPMRILKSELYICSHVPKNSSVFLFLNQFFITSAALELSDLAVAISVMQI